MKRIPDRSVSPLLKQTNRSDVLGDIWSSFNLDLVSNLGKTRVSPRLLLAAATTNYSGSTVGGVPVAIEWLINNKYYVVAGSDIYTNTATNQSLRGDFTIDSNSWGDLSSDYSDGKAFNGKLYVSTNARTLHRTDGTTYATTGNFFSGSFNNYPHMLCPYGSGTAYRLYGADAQSIVSMNTSEVVQADTTLDNAIAFNSYGVLITFIVPASNGMWVGTINTFGGKGHVYFWNGVDHTTATDYLLESSGALAGVIKDDVLQFMDCDGKLMGFSGGAFKEIGRLPVDQRYLYNTISTKNDRWIHPNGITIVDGRVNILINNQYLTNSNPIAENIPSGVWEFDPTIGFYHKKSFSYYKDDSGAITDYGQNKIARVGCLYSLKSNSTVANDNGTLFAGCSYYDGNTTTVAGGLFIDDSNDLIQKYGYLVTTKNYSGNIQDSWDEVYARHKKLLASTDKITVKYRTDETDPTYISLTWVTTSRFTTTTNLTGYEGYEVEIINGAGGGMCAHITSVTGSGTYTVELDETFTGVTIWSLPAAYARIQAWKKAGVKDNQEGNLSKFMTENPSTWIQLKVCMLFTGKNELEDILIDNKKYK